MSRACESERCYTRRACAHCAAVFLARYTHLAVAVVETSTLTPAGKAGKAEKKKKGPEQPVNSKEQKTGAAHVIPGLRQHMCSRTSFRAERAVANTLSIPGLSCVINMRGLKK